MTASTIKNTQFIPITMKKATLFLFALTFLLATDTFAQVTRDAKKPDLSRKIDYLNQKHQDLRNRKNDILRRHGWDSKQMKENDELIKEALATNYKVAKQIFEEHGLPTATMVGAESAHNFWDMVLHFDHDVIFQRTIVSHMDRALESNEVSKKDFAYLSDRVLINMGRKQYYGTQLYFDDKTNSYKAHPVENEDRLTQNRADMDLPPMENYVASMNETYKGSVQKPGKRKNIKRN